MERDIIQRGSSENVLKNANQPAHCYHKIYLLQKLREMENETADESVRKSKVEILCRLNSERRKSVSSADDVYAQISRLCKSLPVALDTMSVLKWTSTVENVAERRSVNVNDFIDRCIVSAQPLASLTSFESTSDRVIDFFFIIETLSEFFNPSTDEEFMLQRNQLMEILNMIKDYKSADETLNNLRLKYEELCAIESEFTGILGQRIL